MKNLICTKFQEVTKPGTPEESALEKAIAEVNDSADQLLQLQAIFKQDERGMQRLTANTQSMIYFLTAYRNIFIPLSK